MASPFDTLLLAQMTLSSAQHWLLRGDNQKAKELLVQAGAHVTKALMDIPSAASPILAAPAALDASHASAKADDATHSNFWNKETHRNFRIAIARHGLDYDEIIREVGCSLNEAYSHIRNMYCTRYRSLYVKMRNLSPYELESFDLGATADAEAAKAAESEMGWTPNETRHFHNHLKVSKNLVWVKLAQVSGKRVPQWQKYFNAYATALERVVWAEHL